MGLSDADLAKLQSDPRVLARHSSFETLAPVVLLLGHCKFGLAQPIAHFGCNQETINKSEL